MYPHSPSACHAMQRMATLLSNLMDVVNQACIGTDSEALFEAHHPEGEVHDIAIPAYWQRLQAEVIQPLSELAAAAEIDARPEIEAWQVQIAVEVAEALATRPCAHAGCTRVGGPSEAALSQGKRCSACRLMRYCGAACQKADWRAHKAACAELQRKQGGGV